MNAQRRLLWTALVGLSVGAMALHYKIHPPSGGTTYLIANLFAAADLVMVSILFLSKASAVWGLLLNSFLAFLGIILMSDYSLDATIHGWIKISPVKQPLAWLLQTTFPDVVLAAVDFLVGLVLYNTIIGGARTSS